MVCKEEVYMWFRNLKSSKRIEAMCCLLNMCFPLELRFYGTCLEDIGRKDFYVFRDEEMKANDLSEILKIRNIHEPSTRSKLIIVLSLLNSSNVICAKELFKVLSEEIKIEILASLGILSDLKLVDHYLLVLELAQRHPAFSFEQQTFLGNLSLAIENYTTELHARARSEEPYVAGSYYPERVLPHLISEKDALSNPHYRHAPSKYIDPVSNQVQITSLKVKGPHRKMYIRIRVAWDNNKVTDAYKTANDLFVFHQKLVQLFPSDAKNTPEKCIPPLPYAIETYSKQNVLSDIVVNAAVEYIQQLNVRLPSYIVSSDFFRNFFVPVFPNRASLVRPNRFPDNNVMDAPPKNSRLRSLIVYNSQMSDNSPSHHPENRIKVALSGHKKPHENASNACPHPSPINSPRDSPLSSPYASPLNSEASSRAPSPWNAATTSIMAAASPVCADTPSAEKIHPKGVPEHWDPIQNYKIEELQAMPIQELESLGILKDTGAKSKEVDSKSPPNGIGCYIPKNALLLKNASNPQPNSNDSSPVCSEYSSPPQSPSPGEACNQSSSLSSGTEESLDKRPLCKALNEICKVEESESNVPDSHYKRTEDENMCLKSNMTRASVSVIPFAVPYNSLLPPPPSVKPAYLPIQRTNSVPQHLTPGTVLFDNQYSRVPLPSALTFLPGHQRSHGATPDRVMPPASLPLSSVSPFPVATSGCTTVPSAACTITTHRSSNMTAVSNSGASGGRYAQKNSSLLRDGDLNLLQQTADGSYAAAGYLLNSSVPLTAVSCSCFTTNSARPTPSPSPSIISPGAQPPAATMSYLGMPYLFHSLPFLQAQPTANGFVPQPGLANSGQAFSYTLPNGIAAISPELIYPGQTFTLQSAASSPGNNPCQVAGQCFGAFPSAVPVKLVTCYNCGKVGHRGPDCKEQTMEDMNKSGKFQLNYNPVPKLSDSHD